MLKVQPGKEHVIVHLHLGVVTVAVWLHGQKAGMLACQPEVELQVFCFKTFSKMFLRTRHDWTILLQQHAGLVNNILTRVVLSQGPDSGLDCVDRALVVGGHCGGDLVMVAGLGPEGPNSEDGEDQTK